MIHINKRKKINKNNKQFNKAKKFVLLKDIIKIGDFLFFKTKF